MKGRILVVTWFLLTLASLGLYLFHSSWLVVYFQNPPEALLDSLAASGISFGLFVFFNALNQIGLYCSFFVVAQLIALRRGREWFPFITAVGMLAAGTSPTVPAFPEFYEFALDPPLLYNFLFLLFALLFGLCVPYIIVSYPDGRLVPRWTIWAAGGAVLILGVYVTNQFVLGTLTGLPALGVGGAILAAFAALVYAQVWRYRHYLTPLQRQQVKWFLFGVAIVPFAFLPWVILGPTWTSPDLADPNHIPTLSFLLVWTLWLMALPISVGIAILRYRLWDIDLIIRRTVTYALVTAFLLVVFFGSVVVLQQLFAAFTGDVSSRILSGIGIVRDDTSSGGNELITVISTLAIAALFVPVRNRIQDVIDRRFNRKKYDAQQVLQNFGETVRDETDLERLTSELVNVVQETMQPKSVSLWLKREE